MGEKVEQVGPYLSRIPLDARPGIREPALVVADERLMAQIRNDASLEQLAKSATLPGIVKAALALADIEGQESNGCIPGAPPEHVSEHALERGRRQLGALGSGNPFLEVQVVDEVCDEAGAARLGLSEGAVTVMIHAGSRGLGRQVWTDSLRLTERALKRYGIAVPDRQLACAPVDSEEARTYLGAMRAAANFAFANRQVITHWAREAFTRTLGLTPRQLGMRTVYDVAHNIAKEEEHEVNGHRRRLLVHRKGANRAFPGQPVLVPGDMGRYSFVLLGTEIAMRETFGSTCHGAGRVMSRTAAVKAAR